MTTTSAYGRELYNLLNKIQQPYETLVEFCRDIKSANILLKQLKLPLLSKVTPQIIPKQRITRVATPKQCTMCINHPEIKHYRNGLCNECFVRKCINHPERRHVANGLCKTCFGYKQHTGKDRPKELDLIRNRMCINHPDRKHFAKGLCSACYGKTRAKRPRTMVILPCVNHPERYGGKVGLCERCKSKKNYKYVAKIKYNRTKPLKPVVMCTNHPERVAVAKGFCMRCYKQNRRASK